MSSNWYIQSFENQIERKKKKIPKGRFKKCRIYIEVFEDDIEFINLLIDKTWGLETTLVCAISSYGLINQIIEKSEQYMNINEIKNLRNNFGFKVIYLDFIVNVFGESTSFFDKLKPSNWFLRKTNI
jgi:hypothetical protein